MPADHRLWVDHRQCRKRFRNQPRQPDEQQTIGVVEGRSPWRLAPEHVDLLAKNQDLRFTPRAGLEQSDQRTEKQSEQLDHRATASPNSHRFASCLEFPTGTPGRSRSSYSSYQSIFGIVSSRILDDCGCAVPVNKRPRNSADLPTRSIVWTIEFPIFSRTAATPAMKTNIEGQSQWADCGGPRRSTR